MRRILLIASACVVLAIVPVLAGCGPAATSGVPDPTGVSQETTETSVYFSTGRSIFEERVVVDATNPYKAVLDTLVKAEPTSDKNVAIVQPDAKIRSVTVKDGVATVDWSREVLDFKADPKEKVLALASVLRTLGEFQEIQKVRFTVEGQVSGKIGGKDVEKFWDDVSLKGQPWPVIRRDSGTPTEDASTTTNP